MHAAPMVLVCTDRASRGIDTAHVEHVVLFDFPRDPSEYVRRAGRVSRGAGGTGLVSILVLGRQVCCPDTCIPCLYHKHLLLARTGTFPALQRHGARSFVALSMGLP